MPAGIIPKKYSFIKEMNKIEYAEKNVFNKLRINKQFNDKNKKFNIKKFIEKKLKEKEQPLITIDKSMSVKETDDIFSYWLRIFALYMDTYLLARALKYGVNQNTVTVVVAGAEHTKTYVEFFESNGYKKIVVEDNYTHNPNYDHTSPYQKCLYIGGISELSIAKIPNIKDMV